MSRRTPGKAWEPLDERPGVYYDFKVRANARMYNRIIAIHNRILTHGGMAGTLRKILYMGLDAYDLNQLEGNTTAKKARAAAEQRRAKAEATAAQREAEKRRKQEAKAARQGKSKDASKAQQSAAQVPLLVPLEFADEDEV